MLEKLVESWLDSAGERSYQPAFCQMLAAEGHLVLHSTRHSQIEFGKDIISVAPDRVACAFQLKGNPKARLTLTQFNTIRSQIQALVTQPIVYPGLNARKRHHRSYLVTNGEIDEEVQRAVDDLNRGFQHLYGANALQLWSRGRMFDMAMRLGSSLWPAELGDLNTLLELLVHSGEDQFPAAKFHLLLAAILEPILEVWIHAERIGRVKRRSMMRIMARRMKAATVRAYRSKSRARRRLRLIHASVRSTIQRLGSTTNLCNSLRLTISTIQ